MSASVRHNKNYLFLSFIITLVIAPTIKTIPKYPINPIIFKVPNNV